MTSRVLTLIPTEAEHAELVCPLCGQGHVTQWRTSIPLFGTNQSQCHGCDKDIHFTVYPQYTVIPPKEEPR